MSKKIMIISFLILFSLIKFSSALQISEIMYSPSATNESYREWIEIYNNESFEINLENTSICNNNKPINPGYTDYGNGLFYENNDFNLMSKSYAIITANITDVYDIYNLSTPAFHINSSKLCSYGLSNEGGEIEIRQNNISLDRAVYENNAKNINSISRSETAGEISFINSIPTPGYANQFVIVDSENNSNDESNSQSQEITGASECDWKMEIIIEKEIFEEADKFTFKTKASKILGLKTNISGEARLINTKGDVIKRYALFDNYEATYSKTVTINNQEASGEMRLEAELKTACGDTDIDNNIATQYVYVKKNEAVSTKEREQRRTPLFESESRLEIDGSDDKADLFFYRGNISKYAVYITLNSDGEKTKQTIHLKDKFSEYSMTLPFPKCSSENIIALDGLGLHEDKTFIKENPCQIQGENATNKNIIAPEYDSINEVDQNDSSQIKSGNNLITGNSILDNNNLNQKSFFEDFDAKRTSLIVLLALSIMMNVLFIWYR